MITCFVNSVLFNKRKQAPVLNSLVSACRNIALLADVREYIKIVWMPCIYKQSVALNR
jgi:hypothetical protein